MPNKEAPEYKFETLQVHAGYQLDPVHRARGVPIYASTSYVFNDSKEGADLFALRKAGNIYSRLTNPTVSILENRIAALEGGVAAVAFSSGTAAIFNTILSICQAGDNIVATTFLYGGSVNMFKVTLPRLGINVHIVNSDNVEDLAAKFDDKTKAVFVETIGNPTYNIPNISEIAQAAHNHGIPLIVDNTFGMGGYLCRPIDHGADIVVHSITKWVGGHGLAIGGVAVDAGSFPWNNGKFPLISAPSDSYHGLSFWDTFGSDTPDKPNVAFAVKMRAEMLRDVGACLNAMDAWMFLVGLETLSLRADKHCENTLAVAQWLEKHPQVAWVSYPGLESHPYHNHAKEVFKKGFGGVLSFGLKGNPINGNTFVSNVKLASNLANVGDAKTLVIHPSTTTHSQLNDDEKIASGITPDLVRVSVGIEHIDDIIADFDKAISSIKF
ncbi:O-acetylhomoserine (thiol)-lyase [Smittium culicis]|uniref:O-acetylhomoserine (Thiol)-lyase n=1 Tax=Smittium culicis TaxID=133412 RepID=A0A1R1Y820_9FUNG|nr:O-acetylhomoserine (thiol)-lyase [Smittium culicis]